MFRAFLSRLYTAHFTLISNMFLVLKNELFFENNTPRYSNSDKIFKISSLYLILNSKLELLS